MLGLSALMSKRSLTAAKTVYLEGLSTHLSRKYSALPSPRLAMFKTTSSRDVRRISGFTNGVKLKRTICKRVLINVRWGFENLTSPDFQWSTFVPISNGVRFLNGFNSLDHYIKKKIFIYKIAEIRTFTIQNLTFKMSGLLMYAIVP